MIIFKTATAIQAYLISCKLKGQTYGFVPTMGAIHEGHLTLVQKCRQEVPIVVASIFVNPTQFNDAADYEKYPITLEQDIFLLEQAGCSALFLPTISEMYPKGIANLPQYSLGNMATMLEGVHRPGHFQGVCQVVDKLLQIINPEVLVLGQKDYQQCMIINKLLELTNKKINIVIAPTQREESGLAMSSRNLRLSDSQKTIATHIYRNLAWLRNQWNTSSLLPHQMESIVTKQLLEVGFTSVDYISICNAITLQPLATNSQSVRAVALVAATIGEVRLIDNLLLD